MEAVQLSLTRKKSGKAKEETNDYIFERGCVSCMLLLVCVRGVCWGVFGVCVGRVGGGVFGGKKVSLLRFIIRIAW